MQSYDHAQQCKLPETDVKPEKFQLENLNAYNWTGFLQPQHILDGQLHKFIIMNR